MASTGGTQKTIPAALFQSTPRFSMLAAIVWWVCWSSFIAICLYFANLLRRHTIEFYKCRLSSTAIMKSLSKQCHHKTFFLPFRELEAFSLILICFAYRSFHLKILRKIELNSKPQQDMASLSKLRTSQSTCSYYIKAPCSIAVDVGYAHTGHGSATISSRMQTLGMHFVVVVDVVILIFEGLVGGMRSEARGRKCRRKKKGKRME